MEFLDNVSEEIYGALTDFYKSGNYEYLVQAIELNGIKADGIYSQKIRMDKQIAEGKKLVLYGLGHDANKYLMEEKEHKNTIGYHYITWFSDIDWYKYCDKNVKEFDGHKVMTLEELMKTDGDFIFYITSSSCMLDIAKDLVNHGVNINNIFQYNFYDTRVYDDKQYIDSFIEAKEEDIVIDAGAYTCDFTERFIKWNKGEYKEIIAFEPDYRNYIIALKNAKKMQNVKVINAAVGEESMKMLFEADKGASSVLSDTGESEVDVMAIDDMGLENVSYIKLDVEGFELEALKGARNTIKKFKPRLAICLYHKKADIIKIPEFIEELGLDYKFYVRIYSNTYLEIVLYCI